MFVICVVWFTAVEDKGPSVLSDHIKALLTINPHPVKPRGLTAALGFGGRRAGVSTPEDDRNRA